ncbi:hypothetical protein [Halorhabdus sp. BNX81]|uniref:hypothetical protein n=1 Tax=Halorhabdus sp. BNX81 TaxID=2980181 RepID=UPI0023DD1769|nr:hypothetical protein [Halorhabdus sp. BNX81]
MSLLSSESTTAGQIARLFAAETAEYVTLLVVWASISLAVGPSVPRATLVAVVLAVMDVVDRRPCVGNAFAFLGVRVFLQPVAFWWLFVPGWSWLYFPTQVAILAISFVVAFHWGPLETSRRLREGLDRVVKTDPGAGAH